MAAYTECLGGKISARGNALYLSELSGKPEDIARFMEVMKQYGELNGVEIKTDNDFDPNDPTTPSGGGGRRDDVDFSIEEINKYAESVETKRPTDEVKRNIKSGLSALRMLANGKEVVHGAMNRPDIEKYGGDSSISFYFGKVGIPDKNYKKGYGISHIAAKHGKDTLLKKSAKHYSRRRY